MRNIGGILKNKDQIMIQFLHLSGNFILICSVNRRNNKIILVVIWKRINLSFKIKT